MSFITPDRRLYQTRAGPSMHAFSPEPPPARLDSFTGPHAITLILTALLLILFFVGFFSIYFCRCFMDNLMSILNSRARNPIGTPVNPTNPDPPGLDPSIIESFPAFEYASVKDYRGPSNCSLECAICLSEFQEDDVIRLVPECWHVFHKDCIDLWLASHKSCPVCRRCLDPGPDPDPGPLRPDSETEARGPEDEDGAPSFSIAVKEEPDSPLNRFSRSHSTGHSIVRVDDEAAKAATGEEKYILRLPEHVIKESMKRGHAQALSCTTFGEMSSQRRNCFGEISGHSCNESVKQ